MEGEGEGERKREGEHFLILHYMNFMIMRSILVENLCL